MMTRLWGVVLCMVLCMAARAQSETVPDAKEQERNAQEAMPDTTHLQQFLAEIDSLLRLDELHKQQREAEAQKEMLEAAQRRMMESVKYVHIGKKIELGPISRIVMRNSIDGFRPRFGGRTTAALHPQWFFKGYYSRGFKSEENYFSARATYSMNKKLYQPDEYPQRSVSVTAMRDIGMPFEIFNSTYDENFLTSLRWTSVGEFVRINRQQIDFDYDFNRMLKASAQLSMQKIATIGDWSEAMRTTMHLADVTMEIDLRPTKNSVVSLSHRAGIKGFLRSDYDYNITEIAYSNRIAAGAGHVDIGARAGAEWNKVPFMLLCLPAANMAYFSAPSTFMLINNHEFANDRYLSMMVSWDCGGVLLSRIPFLRMLGCHEMLGFRTLWGTVTNKNDYGISRMDGSKPYCECSVGICNILGLISVEYVHRLNYLDLPTAHRHGVRIGLPI